MHNSCSSGSWQSCRSFLEQLRQLIETVRQMVSGLQRTSKLRTTTGGQHVRMYSSNSILPERVGVGEAPNSHYLLYFLQHHILFNQNNNELERDMWGARESRLRAFELSFVYDSVNYEGGMIEVAVIITYQYCCCVVRTVECNFYGLPYRKLFFFVKVKQTCLYTIVS